MHDAVWSGQFPKSSVQTCANIQHLQNIRCQCWTIQWLWIQSFQCLWQSLSVCASTETEIHCLQLTYMMMIETCQLSAITSSISVIQARILLSLPTSAYLIDGTVHMMSSHTSISHRWDSLYGHIWKTSNNDHISYRWDSPYGWLPTSPSLITGQPMWTTSNNNVQSHVRHCATNLGMSPCGP